MTAARLARKLSVMISPGFADQSDEVVAGRAVAEPAAFQALYDRYARRVFGLLATLRIDPHTADDIAQQAWLKAWKAIGTRADGPFGPWLMQIVRNTAIDQVRRKKLAALPEGAEFAAAGHSDVLRDLEETAELDRLRACVAKLPDIERRVFQGRLDGIDSPAVAQAVGLTAERVHRVFHDAKQKLQRCLGVRP